MDTFAHITDQLILSLRQTFVLPSQELAVVAGKCLTLAILLTFCLILIKSISRMVNTVLAGRLPSPMIRLILAVVKWLILAGTFLLIFQQFGIRLNSLWALASTLLAMVAIGFVALWSVLSNLLCTLMLILLRPFRIGDEIEVIDPAMTQGVGGRVRNINLIFTTLDAADKEAGDKETTLLVPNNLFFQKILKRKRGKKTHGLQKQVFEEKSLLNTDSRSR